MARLIDADLLKQNCKCTGRFEDNFKGVDLIELAKVIDAQPTAYDVDAVVEELEDAYENHGDTTEHYKEYVFDIVRKGGVDG